MGLIKKWNLAHALFMIIAGIAALVFNSVNVLIGLVILSFLVFLFLHRKMLAEFRPWGGYANWVSLFRFSLILGGGMLLNFWKPVYCFPFFLVALCLDGLDGYLARKFDQATDFGAYLDMETDAFFVAFLSTFWYLDGRVGGWILLIGFLRYLYVWSLKIFRLEKKKEQGTKFAKIIAVLIMSALLAPFVLPEMVYQVMIIVASLLTIYSFGVSFISRIKSR